MKKATIYLLRGGLKHFRSPQEGELPFYYDSKEKRLYPTNQKLEDFDEFELVEANIATGREALKAMRELKLPRERTKIRGTAETEFGKKFVDILEPSARPDPERVLIAFAGKPGSMKSFLSRGLEMSQKIPVIQIGKELQKMTDVGDFGEKLFKEEQKNPYIVGEMLLPLIQKYSNEKVIIIDGVKSYETALFLSYATHRPIFLFYTELNEELRREFRELRLDKDDYFAKERDKMFEKGLRKLKNYAYSELDMGDWRTLEPLSEVLEGLEFRTTKILDIPNPFGSKQPFLELYRRNVEKLIAKKTKIDRDFSEYIFHKNYPERLKKHGVNLNQERAEVVNLVASAFRMVDDFLDEHKTREGQPTFWQQEGIVKSIYYATLMTVKAHEIAEKEGLSKEFQEMFRRVIEAVFYELRVEDGIEECREYKDWLRAAEREVAFREFLAHLAGTPERVKEFREWGIKAQIKDDIMGAKKGGREDTEIRLKRPIFKKEWLNEIDAEWANEIKSELSAELQKEVIKPKESSQEGKISLK